MIRFLSGFFFLCFLFSVQIAFSQRAKVGQKGKSGSARKNTENNLSPSLFTLGDSTSRTRFSRLSTTDAGNLEEPLIIILASGDLADNKAFHVIAHKVAYDTRNGVRSIATPIRGNLAEVLFINSQEGLDFFFANPANKNLKIFIFHGLKELESCKDPVFKALDSKKGISKFLPGINTNFFPGQNGPVEFIQKEERIQN